MSLSGNLGFVSLDEVLRLLTRSNQQGSVNVSSEEIRGRIFVTKGGVALATTSDDAGIHRHLVKSGLVDEAFLRRVEAGEETLAPIVEKSGGALTELLREMTVESIYRLGLKGDAFEIQENAETHYGSTQAFELEGLIEDSKQRLTDWTEVSRTVTDLHELVRFHRDLGERDQVTIDSDAWRVLSEIGSGSSVAHIAGELGTTEFWTARIAARLVNDELISFDRDEAEAEAEPMTQEFPREDTWQAAQAEDGTDDQDVKPDESWWEEPEEDEATPAGEISDGAAAADVGSETDEAESNSIFGAYASARDDEPVHDGDGETSPIPTLTAEAEAESEEVEDDTEAFLEKVFSELETAEEEPEEEGYGLLRRRRMGAIRESSPDA